MEAVSDYFNGEKESSIIYLVIGIIGLIISVYILTTFKKPFYLGIVIPLIVFALLETVMGGFLIIRSPKDIVRVKNMIQFDKAKLEIEEIPRMEKVMKKFTSLKILEYGLILGGTLLILIFNKNTFWAGCGYSLLIQGVIMFLIEYFAERRGKIYFSYLQELI